MMVRLHNSLGFDLKETLDSRSFYGRLEKKERERG
jgi:hypothetical protein